MQHRGIKGCLVASLPHCRGVCRVHSLLEVLRSCQQRRFLGASLETMEIVLHALNGSWVALAFRYLRIILNLVELLLLGAVQILQKFFVSLVPLLRGIYLSLRRAERARM